MTAITLDFRNDWKEFLSGKPTGMGFKYDIQKTLEENTIGYFNTKRKVVSNKPRAVHESRELSMPLEHAQAYLVVKELISLKVEI